jgi:hypothetical protein
MPRRLLTKAKLVDATTLAELEAALDALNPGAPAFPYATARSTPLNYSTSWRRGNYIHGCAPSPLHPAS